MRRCNLFKDVTLRFLKCLILFIVCAMLVLCFPCVCYGRTEVCLSDNVYCDTAAADLSDNVCKVRNEKELLDNLVKGMRSHKSNFSYYYPGIEKQFCRYKKKGYREFFDKIGKRDGYLYGIISGYCVSECGASVKYVSIQVCYLTTKKQEKKIDKKVKWIVKNVGKGSRRTKILNAHDYLVNNMSYDSRYYSSYDAFTKGRGMCMAYALAFQRLMQEMNIPCRYIKGKEHAWNEVKLGNRWYLVDVTFDDSTSSYRYFLK